MQLLLKEASGLHEAKEREVEKKRGIVDGIRRLQSQSSRAILLSRDLVAVLGAERGEIEDGELVLANAEGAVLRKPLELLDDYIFLAVIEDCSDRLLDAMSKATAEQARPVLEVRTGVKGGQVLIFDWRSYCVSLRNTGPDALDVEASVKVLDREHTFSLPGLSHDASADFDLRSFHTLPRTTSLMVEVSCRDALGREYWGETPVTLGPMGWSPIALEAKGDRAFGPGVATVSRSMGLQGASLEAAPGDSVNASLD